MCLEKGRVGERHRRQTEKATVKMQQEPALTGKQQQQQQQERDKVMERQRKGKAPLRSKITEPVRAEKERDEGKTTMNARR